MEKSLVSEHRPWRRHFEVVFDEVFLHALAVLH